MEELRNTLNYLYCGCEIDDERRDEIEQNLDTLDWILNIIECTNVHNQAECVNSITKIKNMTCIEEVDNEDSF